MNLNPIPGGKKPNKIDEYKCEKCGETFRISRSRKQHKCIEDKYGSTNK